MKKLLTIVLLLPLLVKAQTSYDRKQDVKIANSDAKIVTMQVDIAVMKSDIAKLKADNIVLKNKLDSLKKVIIYFDTTNFRTNYNKAKDTITVKWIKSN